MNSGNSFTALVLSVFTAASASVAILSSFRSGAGEDLPIAVSGPEALRRELRAAQAESLPSAIPLTVDAGWRVYTGDEGENAAALAEGLLPAESPDGGTGWPVTVYEDPWTRATVFLNAAGDTIGWLPPPEGFDPEWILSETYPGGVPSWVDPRSFDPASVAVTVWLALGRDILPPSGGTAPASRRAAPAGTRAAVPRRSAGGGTDTDGDGMPDAWETAHGLDPLDPADAGGDPDGDGLANITEYLAGTSPLLADTDGDGLADGEECLAYAAWITPSAQDAPDYTAEWARLEADTLRTPVLDVTASSYDRTVLFANGVAEQRWRDGTAVFYTNVARVVSGERQTLFIDSGGGFLASYCADGGAHYLYSGSFGAMPLEVRGDNGHAVARFADGSVTNAGALAGNNAYFPSFTTNNVPPLAGTAVTVGETPARAIRFTSPAASGSATGSVLVASGACATLSMGAGGTPTFWGRADLNIQSPPADIAGAVRIAGGGRFWSAVMADGTVRGWGTPSYGVSDAPGWVSNAVDVACWEYGTACLLSDGGVALWGQWSGIIPEIGAVSVGGIGQGFWVVTADGLAYAEGVYSGVAVDLSPEKIDRAAFGFPYGRYWGGVARVFRNTSPLLADSDGDGLPDGIDPEPAAPLPPDDGDGDGIPDAWTAFWYPDGNPDAETCVLSNGYTLAAAHLAAFCPTNASGYGAPVRRTGNADVYGIVPNAFSIPSRPASLTNLVTRVFPVRRVNPWVQLFISSGPGTAGGWTSEGISIRWGETPETATNALPASCGDSFRIPLGDGDTFGTFAVTVDLAAPAGEPASLDRPLYLTVWAPEIVPDPLGDWRPVGDGETVHALTAELEPGSGFTLRFAASPAGWPRVSAMTPEEASVYSRPPVSARDRENHPRLSFTNDAWTCAIASPEGLLAALPAAGTNAWTDLLFFSTSVSAPGTVSPAPFGGAAGAYPLDTPGLLAAARRGGAVSRAGSGAGSVTIIPPGEPRLSVRNLEITESSVFHCLYLDDFNIRCRSDDIPPDSEGYEPPASTGPEEAAEPSCGCGDGSEDGPSVSAAQLRFRVSLGAPSPDTRSGFVWLCAEAPGPVGPDAFSILAAPGVEVSTNGASVTLTAPRRVLTLSPAGGGARIGITEDGEYDGAWTVTRPQPDTVRFVRVTRLGNTLSDRSYTLSGGAWSERDNVSGLAVTRAGTPATGVSETVLDGGSLVSSVTNVYILAGGRLLRGTARRGVDGGGAVDLEWGWVEDPRDDRLNGLPRFSLGNRAPWRYHAYDAIGREVLTAVQRDGSAMPDGLRSANVTNLEEIAAIAAAAGSAMEVTLTSYDPSDGDSGHANDLRVPRLEETWRVAGGPAVPLGSVSTRLVRTEDASGAALLTATRTCSHPEAGGEALASSSTSYPDEDGVPETLRGAETHTLSEDGTETFRTLTRGSFDAATGAFTPSADGAFLLTAVSNACPGASIDAPAVVRLTVADPFRRPVREWSECAGTAFGAVSRIYDAKGRLRSETGPDGLASTNAYSCCRLLSSTSRDGALTLRSAVTGLDSLYYAEERPSLAADTADGAFPVTQRFFDAAGRATATVERASLALPGAFEDPAADDLSGAAPRAVRTSYSAGGTAETVTAHPGGRVRTRTETATRSGRTVIETDSGGGIEKSVRTEERWGGDPDTWTFSDHGTLLRLPTTEWDASGLKSEYDIILDDWETAPVTNSVTRFDALGRVAAVETPDGVTSNVYVAGTSRLAAVIGEDGVETRCLYASDGSVARTLTVQTGVTEVSETGYRMEGGVLWRVGTRVSLAPDGAARTNGVSRVRLTSLSPALLSEEVTVDAAGLETRRTEAFDTASLVRTLAVSNSAAATPSVTRTRFGRVIGTSGADGSAGRLYGGFGEEAVTASVLPSGVTNAVRTLLRDAAGNVATSVVAYADGRAVTNSAAHDPFGNAVRVTDANGLVSERAFDADGRPVSSGGADYPAFYGYDARGRLIYLQTTRDWTCFDETFLTRDAAGRVTERFFPDWSSVSNAYGPGGRPAATVNARGGTVSYAYDTAGRPVSIGADTLAYGSFGDLASGTFGYGSLAYARDALGRATNETLVTCDTYRLGRAFDALGRVASIDIDGLPVSYGYDAEGRLSTVSCAAFTVTYAYTPDGLDAGYAIACANGTAITRALARDPFRRGWVTGVTNAVNGVAVKAYALTRDPGGRVTARNGEAYAYNARNELASAVYPNAAYAYAYDEIGNSVSASLGNAATLYTANSRNQYTAVLAPGAADPEEPEYDADGNLETFNGQELYWDSRNRLVYAEGGGIDLYGLYECGYDVQGRLVFKDAPHGGDYLWDGWRMVKKQEWLGLDLGETVEYVWGKDLSGTMDGAGGVGGLLAVRVDGAWHFPLYDHNGNVVMYISESGAVSAEYEYDPFGKVIAHTGRDFDFLFSTKFYDPDIGMYYYGYRHYSPELRRWASPDPIGEAGGLNLYGFCGNDGVNGWDFLGLDFFESSCCPSERIWIELQNKLLEAIDRSFRTRIEVPLKGNNPKTGKLATVSVFYFREYAGYICCDPKRNTVSSTGPFPGTWRFTINDTVIELTRNSDLNKYLAYAEIGRIKPAEPTSGNVAVDDDCQCPKGTSAVVFYHTHGERSTFSPSDIGFSRTQKIPIALLSMGRQYFEVYGPEYYPIQGELLKGDFTFSEEELKFLESVLK